jgi:hypothetical protein
MFIFEPPAGLEPASDDPYSPILPLNYGGLAAQVEGFEPPSTVLETGMLPLHHTYVFFEVKIRIELILSRFCRPTPLPVLGI